MLLLEGIVKEKNWVDRFIFSYIKQIWQDIRSRNYPEIKELAFDREKWKPASN